LPWAHIDTGIDVGFLKREYERTRLGQETPNCSSGPCNLCGLQQSQDRCRKKYKELIAASKLETAGE